jgi:hypothetical protein
LPNASRFPRWWGYCCSASFSDRTCWNCSAITIPSPIFFAELGKLLLRGEVVPDALLAHLAPLGWQHINLTGDYLWDPDATLGPDGFRRLRTTSIAPLAAAA